MDFNKLLKRLNRFINKTYPEYLGGYELEDIVDRLKVSEDDIDTEMIELPSLYAYIASLARIVDGKAKWAEHLRHRLEGSLDKVIREKCREGNKKQPTVEELKNYKYRNKKWHLAKKKEIELRSFADLLDSL